MKRFYCNSILIRNVKYGSAISLPQDRAYGILGICFRESGRILFILLLYLMMSYSMNAFATDQWPDLINYNGKKYLMHTFPLEQYFLKNPNIKLESIEEEKPCSCLWRRYVAIYEIKNNLLIMKSIVAPIWDSFDDTGRLVRFGLDPAEMEGITWLDTQDRKKWKDILPELIDHAGTDIVKMKWFSGVLVIPDCEAYKCKYNDNSIFIEIKNGIFIKETKINYEEYVKLANKGLLPLSSGATPRALPEKQ